MALRYQVPGPLMDIHPADRSEVVPCYKAASVVEFRRGADMTKLAREVLASPSSVVDAAVGAGKSVLLPPALARVSKTLVYHVVPNRFLALDLYRYQQKLAVDSPAPVELAYMRSLDFEVPASGVVYVGAADLVASILASPGGSLLNGRVVYLDEAHESDAYTYVVRYLARALGASNLVLASATLGSSGYRRRESVGVVETNTYSPDDTPESWVVTGNSNPWCVAVQTSNLLVYTDSRTQARKLSEMYTEVGMLVYRLQADMSEVEFTSAMRAVRDKNGPLVVLIADYSFRSGFTFEVGTIIDTGRVYYYDGSGGTVRKVSRPIFQFEAEQTAGRGGRLSGLRTKYYRPAGELEPVLCELEGTELEAAAYIFRCLGYKPNADLAAAAMARMYVTGELSTLLNAVTPLAMMAKKDRVPEYKRESLVSAGVVKPKMAEVVPGALDEVVETGAREEFLGAKRASIGSGLSGDTLDGFSGRDIPDAGKDNEEQLEFVMASFMDQGADTLKLDPGKFYVVEGTVGSKPLATLAFPAGLSSLLRIVEASGRSVVKGFSYSDKRAAVKLVQDRYNVLNVELIAMRDALSDRSSDLVKHRSQTDVRDYFVAVLERASAYEAERAMLLSLFKELTRSFSSPVVEVDQPLDLVSERAGQYVKEFSSVLGLTRELVDVDGFSRDLAYELEGEEVRMDRENGNFRKRRDEYKRSRRSEEMVKMPKWTGMRSIYYQYEGDNIAGVTVTKGKLFRSLTGSDTWTLH